MFGRMHSSDIGKLICTIKKQVTGLVFRINLSNCSKKEYLCDIFQKFIKKNKLYGKETEAGNPVCTGRMAT